MTTRFTVWTVGHSTRTIDEFIALLCAHKIQWLIDVRTVPRSRHNPQFNTDALAKSLKKAGLGYTHMPSLGGLRKANKDSINAGWRNANFRGYADYMQTDEFWKGLEQLIAAGKKRRTVIMCAEAVPWRCHRSLIADAILVGGWTVSHIMSEKKTAPHSITSFAELNGERLIYPIPIDPAAAPRLF